MQNMEKFYGPNAGYVLELYERYQQDPASVDTATRAIFEHWTPTEPVSANGASTVQPRQTRTLPLQQPAPSSPSVTQEDIPAYSRTQVVKIVAASTLAHAIRERGHLGAHLDPLGSAPLGDPALQPEYYGLTNDDLAQLSPRVVGGHSAEGSENGLEAIQKLRAMYSGTISYGFHQVKSPDERLWLRDAVGLNLYHREPKTAEARRLLKRLLQVELFERICIRPLLGRNASRLRVWNADPYAR